MNPSVRLPARERACHTNILVVEDDTRIRAQISEFLRQRGFQVFEAASGDDALLFLQHNGAIECVFSDVQMPGGYDGFALARWILANRPGLPILLTSAKRWSEDLDPDLRTKLSILQKPYRGHVVEAYIASLVDQLRRAGS